MGLSASKSFKITPERALGGSLRAKNRQFANPATHQRWRLRSRALQYQILIRSRARRGFSSFLLSANEHHVPAIVAYIVQRPKLWLLPRVRRHCGEDIVVEELARAEFVMILVAQTVEQCLGEDRVAIASRVCDWLI